MNPDSDPEVHPGEPLYKDWPEPEHISNENETLLISTSRLSQLLEIEKAAKLVVNYPEAEAALELLTLLCNSKTQ